MQEALREKVKLLAALPYLTEVSKDETTTGSRIFVALHPELQNCMAQGETVEQALIELADAREEYILSLLEDGLDVPRPEVTLTGIRPVDNTVGNWVVTVNSVGIVQMETQEDPNRLIEEGDPDSPYGVLVRA